MKRAAWLSVIFAAALRAPAAAQPAGNTYRVGILSGVTLSATYRDAFVRALAGLGYREGQNLELLVRSAGGDETRVDALAHEFVHEKPDAIAAGGSVMAAALKRATASIPIVMVNVGDPVGSGFVAGLARPGGNITGVTNITADLEGKRLQLLTELAPNVRRVAFVENPNNPLLLVGARQFRAACRRLGIEGITVDIRSAGEIDGVFRGLPQRHLDALVLDGDAMLLSNARRISERVAALRLPAIYGVSEFPTAGGLVSYGVSRLAQWTLAATYVDRILKGAKPADLPVQQPTTFDLVVNLKAARAIGLTVPPSVLLQATQVIR